MKGGVLRIDNLVLCSSKVFVENEQMARSDTRLLPQELVYMTHGEVLEFGGFSEADMIGMRKLVGDMASRATVFSILRYSEKDGEWMRSDFSHFESAVDFLSRECGLVMP